MSACRLVVCKNVVDMAAHLPLKAIVMMLGYPRFWGPSCPGDLVGLSMRERRYTQVRGQLRDTWPPGRAGTVVLSHMNDDLFRIALGLTVTQVRPCSHGVELIRLLGVGWANLAKISGVFRTFDTDGEVGSKPEPTLGTRSTSWFADWLGSPKMTSPAVSLLVMRMPGTVSWEMMAHEL